MTALAPLTPSRTFDQLFPADAVYAPRTTIDHVGWVLDDPYRLDTLTGMTLLISGAMPLACHSNMATPEIVAFFERCGAALSPERVCYQTAEQAFAVARGWVEQGRRLVSPYPLPASLCDGRSLLVPAALYNWLNDKSNLDVLVDAALLPPAVMLTPDMLHKLRTVFAGSAVYVKACVAGASGAGIDVRHAADQDAREAALAWLSSHAGTFSGVRVELALDIPVCWCLNLSIRDDGVEYLGSAIQLFASPGQQSGSLIDPQQEPPASAVAEVIRIAQNAQRLGYRGLAGFDLGLTPDAQPFVFDLNFRMVSSTVQLLLHASAVARVGARVSESWHHLTAGPLWQTLAALDSFGSSGAFVPCRVWQATPESHGRNMVTGFLVGDSTESVADTRRAMASALSDVLV